MAVEKYGSGSKTDVVVKLVLVFVVCLLSFSIGAFVGKKFSDNQHKLAQFEPANQDRDVASVQENSTEVKPNNALSDDEVAKLAEEFVEDGNVEKGKETPAGTTDKNTESTHDAKSAEGESAAPAKAGEAAETTPAQAVKKSQRSANEFKPMEAADKVANNEVPETEVKAGKGPGRIPSSLPKELGAAAVGKYTVQVASYPTEDMAQKMTTDLKGKGFTAFYVTAKIVDPKDKTQKTVFRVSIGLFTTQKEATSYKNDLIARAKVSSAIVQKITE